MKQTLGRIIRFFGKDAVIDRADGQKTVRAFLQPITASGWERIQSVIRELGEIPMGRYLYLGPADTPLYGHDRLRYDGQAYTVCQAETLYCRDEPLYVWGMLRRCGEDFTDAQTG